MRIELRLVISGMFLERIQTLIPVNSIYRSVDVMELPCRDPTTSQGYLGLMPAIREQGIGEVTRGVP